jgi:hypothetical protein
VEGSEITYQESAGFRRARIAWLPVFGVALLGLSRGAYFWSRFLCSSTFPLRSIFFSGLARVAAGCIPFGYVGFLVSPSRSSIAVCIAVVASQQRGPVAIVLQVPNYSFKRTADRMPR